MSNDIATKISRKIHPAWTGLIASFGPAADSSTPILRVKWNKKKSDIAEPSLIAAKLAEGCNKAWEIVDGIHDESFSTGTHALNPNEPLLAIDAAASQCKDAILSVVNAGMFEEALAGFRLAWLTAPHRRRWAPAETLALICRAAAQTGRRLWPEPMGIDAQMDMLIALPCWAPIGTEWQRDSARIWADVLADLARASARRPELSERCAALVRLSEPLWSTGVGSLEHFGRQLSAVLQTMRFPGGQLDSCYWRALPFKAQLGIVLGANPTTQLGAWAIGRIGSDALLNDDGDGPARRNLEDLCAGIWCGFDRSAIEMLEAISPSCETWLRPGLVQRFSGSSHDFIATFRYAEKSWNSSHAKWARQLASSAGMAPENDHGNGKSWDELILALQALRQALLIDSSLSPKLRKASPAKPSARRRL